MGDEEIRDGKPSKAERKGRKEGGKVSPRPRSESDASNASSFLGWMGAYLEEVYGGLGVDSGVLEDGGDDGSLSVLLGVEGGGKVELEALGELVLELNLGSENVGGSPDLAGAPQRR